MSILEYGTKEILLDDEGYLDHLEDWDEAVARMLAAREGVPDLSSDMLKMLKFIREYYKVFDFFPIVNSICKNINEPKDCVTEKFLTPLIAWKIAGLPHPEEPLISLLKAGQTPG